MFKSDFKYVADYFVQSRKKVDYVPAPGTIRHVHEVLQLLEALTGDQRFENAIKDVPCDVSFLHSHGTFLSNNLYRLLYLIYITVIIPVTFTYFSLMI